MKQDPAEELLTKIKAGYSLPSLSLVALKLVDLASSENSSIDDMARLIETDPALTVRLLRLSNSVFFKSSSPATTIEQAIMRIGSNHLRIMALSLSLRDTFPMGKVGTMDYELFWRSSLYRALLSKTLAQSLATCKSEEAFVAGLVLEIGFLIFHDLFLKGERTTKEFRFYPLHPLLQWEREEFGIDHRQVGEAALRFWRFPDVIVSCQQIHSLDVHSDSVPPLALVADVSREFAALICEESLEWAPVFKKAEEVYGVNQDVLSDILVATFEEVDHIAESLRVGMSRDKDVVSLMQKANNSLCELSSKVLIWQDQLARQPLPSFDALKRQEAPQIKDTLQAVAHEIRNPLLIVGGFAKRLSTSLEQDSEGWKYVQIILEESKRLEAALAAMTGESTAN
ncbi:MAG TPA: HDOD domain-containing protein [Dissulfurispiraceae bacterium]|nr:HDOD domain-containing protein [Dissulfurispiraceae bacterium]